MIAKSYILNSLYFSLKNIFFHETKIPENIRKKLERVISEYEAHKNKPLLPLLEPISHSTIGELINESIRICKRLLNDNDELLVKKILGIFLESKDEWSSLTIKAGAYRQVSPIDLSSALQLDMTTSRYEQICNDFKNNLYGPVKHPLNPKILNERVNYRGLKELNKIVISEILKEEISFDLEIIDNYQDYALYWYAVDDKVYQKVPSMYDWATYLSFECPHSLIHLAHLKALGGNYVYLDSIEERIYFESIAVYSEHLMLEVSYQMVEEVCVKVFKNQISAKELRTWIIQDRLFEFGLRAIRFMADYLLLIKEFTVDQTVDEIYKKTGLDKRTIKEETIKYIHLIGLGSSYITCYKRFLESNTSLDSLLNKSSF